MTSISDTEVVNAPGGLVEVARVTRTGWESGNTFNATSHNASSNIFASNATFIADGSSYLVELFIPLAYTLNGANQVSFGLNDGSTLISQLGLQANAVNEGSQFSAQYIATPAAGVVSYNARVWVNGNAVNLYSYSPIVLRVSKILQASQLLVTQSNAPIVTSLPSGNLVTGQEVYLYTIYGYVRYLWDGSNWVVTSDNRNISFVAHGQAGVADYQGATSGFYNFVFGYTTINNGSGYNSSNGRFTAPVTGLYHFSLNARLDSTPAGGYLRAYIWRPDGGIDAWSPPNLHAIAGNNHATDYHTISISGLRYLTAGQYVIAGGGHISGSSNLLRSESTFTGYLVK